ncbi:MAG: amino acid adenylation domain-containing protein [bacterium]
MQNIVSFNPFVGPEIEQVIPLTQAQAEVWIACQIGNEDANRAYNESVSIILNGNLNRNSLNDAINTVVERHQALRSTFSPDGRFMTVYKEHQIVPNYIDFSSLDSESRIEAVKKYVHDEAHYLFDLSNGPLIKMGLLKIDETKHQLVITAHHIVCDGWSTGILLEEIGSFYSSHILGAMPSVPEPETFSSYVDDEREYLDSSEFSSTEDFWLNQYKESTPLLTLPTDFERPPVRTYKSDNYNYPLDNSVVNDLKKVGIQSGASLVVTLMAAFEVYLYHLTQDEDIVLGLPAAGQSVNGKVQLIGHCVNLLPLRSKIDPNKPFSTYLKERKIAMFDAYEHQQYSFGQLLQKLSITRDPSRVPLVPVMFNIDMGMGNAVSFAGLDIELKNNPRAFETFELFLNATGTEENLNLEWSYNSELFQKETIIQMMNSFEDVIQQIIKDADLAIAELSKVNEQPYISLNDTNFSYPNEALHVLISKQAQKTPNKLAVKFLDNELTYEEFDQKINQIAHLLQKKGLKEGDFVAVCLPRSIELVIVLLAISKCGAAYIPLDATYPSQRLNYMLDDSGSKYLISTQNLASNLKFDGKLLVIGEVFNDAKSYPTNALENNIDPNRIAYILYTSGSTGNPKGVKVTHKNLVNFLCSMKAEPGIEESDRLLSVTTISFDIAGLELFLPLISGASLIIASEEISKDGRFLLELLFKEEITIAQATPTTWQMLLDIGWENKIPLKALSGGEPLSLNLAKSLLKKVDELWNMYGPTETTIWSSTKQILPSDEKISIGHPIANTQFYIFNEQNRLLDAGQTGEIIIGGDGVSLGYLKRPVLTAEKFVSDPHNVNSKLYKTGDLGKLLPNGELICLGRIDQQIKLRGHRIELEEIEKSCEDLELINKAIVVVNNENLICFFKSNEAFQIDDDKIKGWKELLKTRLPEYMLPHEFHIIQEFPTTLNGKVDRKALVTNLSKQDSITSFEGASTPTENIILKIWKEALGLEKIDIKNDFFELGGHSLIGNKVMAILEKETGNRVPLVALLKYPTIKKLSEFIDKEFYSWDSLVPLKPLGSKTPLYIIHGANHRVLMFNELAQHLDNDQPVYGLQSRGLNGIDEPHDSIEQMASDYIKEIVASNPEGPYALAGFSFGGVVAFEMVKQLKAKGKQVALLAQFDSYVFPQYYYNSPILKRLISFLYIIGKVFYLLGNMFTSKKKFKRRARLIKLQIEGVFLRFKIGRKEQYEQQFNVPYKLLESQNKAFSEYTIQSQDIALDLFRATEDVVFVHDHDLLGWKNLAKKGVRKHIIEGNHEDMFEQPNVKQFAKILQEVLDNQSIKKF